MALDKQINLFKVDTTAFMYPEEVELTKQLSKLRRSKQEFNNKTNSQEELNNAVNYNAQIKNTKEKLLNLLESNAKTSAIRNLNPDTLVYKGKDGSTNVNLKRIVSMFESTLSRTFEIKTDELTYDILIVEVFYYDVLKDLILHGFNYNDQHYIYFSSSAGQIRKKKAVFVNESKYNACRLKLTCGLTTEIINSKGGMNVNKYLAYMALTNSATDLWKNVFNKEFDIDKSIVVDDFETLINTKVDEIDYITYEIHKGRDMQVPIPHTDGCGMISSDYSSKNFMIRLPFIKGLLGSFDFKRFIKNTPGATSKIKDIWGKEYDIFNDDIQVIFTKSQLKMYKYYDSWDDYKNNFKKYHCEAGICNYEDDKIPNAQINYQMLQTLYDATEDEIAELCSASNRRIKEATSNIKNALKFFGVYPDRYDDDKKDWFQIALKMYPELLNDPASKNDLKDLKKSLVQSFKGGHLDVVGKFTFVLPDLYAFCQWLFCNEKVPSGLLNNGEVYCRLYKNSKELDCLRSPHLYIEHAIRSNKCGSISNKQSLDSWFDTDAIYTSTFDPISKILQFDVDGDRLLVLAQKKIISMAKRCSKNIYPLYYEMHKAQATQINNETIYQGLKDAFTGGNIGPISNNITKIWNSNEISDEAKDAVKWLCMETNFTIDYAKTLFKPKRPDNVNEIIKKYTKAKVPYFFLFAKKKNIRQIEEPTNNTMNLICSMVNNNRCLFSSFRNLGKVDYLMLLPNKTDSGYSNNQINTIFDMWNRHYGQNLVIDDENLDKNNIPQIVRALKNELYKIESDDDLILNSLIKFMYEKPSIKKKKLLWYLYGKKIVDNLSLNLVGNESVCFYCGRRTTELNYKCQCDKCIKKEVKQNNGKQINTCIDCGESFLTPANNSNNASVCRCEICQMEHVRYLKRAYLSNRKAKNE